MSTSEPRGGAGVQATQLDHAFLRRAYRGSGAVFLAALLLSLTWASVVVSAGVAAGWLLGIGLLLSWQWVASKAFDPKAPRPGLAGLFLLVKLPALGAIVWVLLAKGAVDPIAFALGFLIPQMTIALFAFAGRARRGPLVEGGRREHAPVAPRA